MVKHIEGLAQDEGPVHIDLVYQRLREAWGIGRIGPRIKENIDHAIRLADVDFSDGFLDIAMRTDPPVRVPNDFEEGRRTAEQVPEVELRAAMTHILDGAGSATKDELFTATARIFGWNRRGSDITARLTHVLTRARAGGELTVQGEIVRLTSQA
jgi:hypothetical protein